MARLADCGEGVDESSLKHGLQAVWFGGQLRGREDGQCPYIIGLLPQPPDEQLQPREDPHRISPVLRCHQRDHLAGEVRGVAAELLTDWRQRRDAV